MEYRVSSSIDFAEENMYIHVIMLMASHPKLDLWIAGKLSIFREYYVEINLRFRIRR